ncbi:hypothetical protein BH09BAC6_BH09BAC6_22640 [soil metagenome]|jgi:hypothetical protein
MTTLTVEIDKDKDLSALKDFISGLGLKYQVENTDSVVYTNELINMLDSRYNDYQQGKVELVSPTESKNRIQELLAAKK